MDHVPVAAVAAPQLPASLLAQLWPGHVSGNAEADRKPARKAEVVVAAALLALRDYGLVSYEVTRGKTFMIKTVEVHMRVLGQLELGGIESELLAAAAGSTTVWNTIRRWIPVDVTNPWAVALGHSVNWGLRYGVYQEVVEKRTGIGSVLGDKRSYPLRQDVVAACQPQAETLAARWRQFQAEEAELATELMGKVKGALKSREKQENIDTVD